MAKARDDDDRENPEPTRRCNPDAPTAVIEQVYRVLELWEDNSENRPFYYQA